MPAMATLRGAWRTLRATRAAAVAQPWTGFLDYAEYLAPGPWVQVPSTGKVWHLVGADLPAGIVGPGGKAGSAGARGFAWSSRWQWAKRTAFRFALRCAGLRLGRSRAQVTVPPVEPSRGNATAVVRANQGHGRAQFIALEPETERALRLARPGTYHREYVEARRRFQQYLPAPGFSVSDDGAVLVEDWADGQVLKGLPADRQVAVVVEVLDRCAALVANETVADEGSVWRLLPQLLDEVLMPEVLREPLGDPRVRHLLNSGLLAPSHGDLVLVNVLAEEHRSSWQCVDFDGAGWLPVWWDAVGLAAKFAGAVDDEARRALTEALDRVWAAAGLDGAAGLSDHHWAALAAVKGPWNRSTQASHLSGNGKFVEPDPDDFAWHLHQRAHKIEAQLARR